MLPSVQIEKILFTQPGLLHVSHNIILIKTIGYIFDIDSIHITNIGLHIVHF